MPEPFPNPLINRLTVTALFPYNPKALDRKPLETFQEKMSEREEIELPHGWEERLPEDLSAYRLNRWFFREVKNLLFEDDDESADQADSRRKFRWVRNLEFQKTLRSPPQPLSIAVVGGFVEGKDLGCLNVRVLGQVSELELFALFGEIGSAILGVRWRQEKVHLQESLEAIHYSSLSNGSSKVIAFIPHNNSRLSAIREEENAARKKRYEEHKAAELNTPGNGSPPRRDKSYHTGNSRQGAERGKNTFDFEATPAQLADCLLLPQIKDSGGIPSLVERIWMELKPAFHFPDVCPATRGRVPLTVSMDLKKEKNSVCNTSSEEMKQERQQLEWLCARFLRHPGATGPGKQWIFPVPGGVAADPAVVCVRPTGTRGMFLSSEGFMSVGCLDTEFDNQWHERLENEYFFAYLIALHQSIVLQDISWRSFNRTCGSKKVRDIHDNLFKLFTEFDTGYNFSRISNHVTLQSVYEAARKTLGVPETTDEVRSELQNWIESEQREEQRNLNALAVIAILVSASTYLISLNLSTFTNDSTIDLAAGRGSFYLWCPTLLILLVALINRTMKQHLVRAAKYLFGRV